MKKFSMVFMTVVLCVALFAVVGGAAMGEAAAPVPDADHGVNLQGVSEPMTWSYLATIAGASAFTLLVVQFLKCPVDRIWKIPTRVFAYVIALVTMLVATQFTSGLTVDSALLAVVNAVLAAFAAYGAYEVTFAKRDRAKYIEK